MPETVLSAEEHFETLRESVWTRFAARHRAEDRAHFEDLYSEWWARELERAASGSPSRADAPAAFIAEAVHHVLIDDSRKRARGLGRDEKGALEIVDIDDQFRAAATFDTASAATYEALVHRVLTLIQGRLSERETKVFVFSFLYLQPSEVTAQALGLTHPRVKKDRKKIATKVGAEVWSVLAGELDLCAVYDEKSLPAIFEILTVHVEGCPVCGAALGGVRRGALAVFGPEMILLGTGATEHVTHGLADLVGRINLWMHRGTEALTALPPQGRTAAAVAVAATAVAGGAVSVPKVVARHHHRSHHAARPAPRATVVARATATAAVTARSTPTAAGPRRKVVVHHRAHSHRTAVAAPTREPISFERQAARPAATARPVAAPKATSAPAGKEFGIESP